MTGLRKESPAPGQKQTYVRPYTSSTIEEVLEHLLEKQEEQGEPPYFEAFIDHHKVMAKTQNMDGILNLEDRIKGETDLLTVKIYHGSSNNNATYHYPLTDQGALLANGQGVRKKPQGLATIGGFGGLGSLESVEDHVSKTVQQARREWEFELLRKENQTLKAENKELKERTDIAGLGEILENTLPMLGPVVERFTGGQATGMGNIPKAGNVQFGSEENNELLLAGRNMLELKKAFEENEWQQLVFMIKTLRTNKQLVPQFAQVCKDYLKSYKSGVKINEFKKTASSTPNS